LEIYIKYKYKLLVVHVLRNAKILAEKSGDEGVITEMAEMLATHSSKEELKELLNSTPDS
jgi:tetraacyldisaccharide-1-P 4'-kinase